MARTLLGTILLVSQILTGFWGNATLCLRSDGPSAASMTWLKLAIAANTSMENDPQMNTATILTLCVQSPEVMNTRTMATRHRSVCSECASADFG